MFGRSHSRWFLTTLLLLTPLFLAVDPAAAQQSVTQFIAKTESAITSLVSSLPTTSGSRVVFSGQVVFARATAAAKYPASVLIDYVDGLKAVGAQRVDFNPGITAMNNPAVVANLKTMVLHIRRLGMQLAINPEFTNGELTVNSFADFQSAAMQTYPLIAKYFQPDNFVIVHEPTTMAARMGISTQPSDWVGFIKAVAPLIKQASPHTRLGAGDCVGCNEDDFFSAFVALPELDFVNFDIYSTDFSKAEQWIQTAHGAGKGIYIEETWAPHYFSGATPSGAQGAAGGLETYSSLGSANSVFQQMDADWITAMAKFASAYGLEAFTPYTTEAFFLYVNGNSPMDGNAVSPAYLTSTESAIQRGQVTPTAKAYSSAVSTYGIKTAASVSNASYATLPTVFNPGCGSADNPCNPDSVVSGNMIVSAFGVDLADQTVPSSDWSTSLGGTKATFVDSAGSSFPVQLYSVSTNQVNWLVPGDAANGPGTLTFTSGDGTVTKGVVLVAPVALGLYTSYADGKGPAAAVAICTGTCSGWTQSSGNGQFWQLTFVPGCKSGTCTVPLSWGSNDSLVIELYGTGIRNRAAQSDIYASINGKFLQVQYAAAQGLTGLDQVNVQIPQSMHGAGEVKLVMSALDHVNGLTSNSNTVSLDLE